MKTQLQRLKKESAGTEPLHSLDKIPGESLHFQQRKNHEWIR